MTETDQATVARLAAPAGRNSWIMLGMLCVVSIINYMDRILMSVVSQPVKAEFGLSDTQLGLLTGIAFAFLYAILGFPMGRLADVMSRKKLLAICLGFWSTMTILTGFAASFVQLLFARMAIAFGEAGVSPTCFTLIADSFAARQRNFALGLFTGASMLGVVGGFVLGGWISQHYGWRMTFIVLGSPGVLLALALTFLIKEPVRGATDARVAEGTVTTRQAFRILRRNAGFLFLLGSVGANAMCVFATSQWMPQFFLRSHGLTLSQVGLLFGVAFGIGMFLGNIAGGLIGDVLGKYSIGRPLWLSVIASLLIIPIYWVALLTPSATIAVAMTFLAAFVGSSANPPSTAASQNLVPANVRGTAAAMTVLSVAIFGIGCGPFVVGVASDLLTPAYGVDGLRYALMGLQGINVVAAILYGLTARYAKDVVRD